MNSLRILMLGASLDQNGGIATLEKLILKHTPSNIEIQHVTSHDEGSILHRVIVFTKALLALLWRLLRRDVDLVHIHLSDGGSLLRKAMLTLLASLFRIPVLMHANGAEFHFTYASLPKGAQQCLSSIFRQCRGFIAVTQLWKDYYITNLGLNEEQVFVLPNPAELPAQVPNRTGVTKIKLIFCGRIGQRKGAFDLIRAFAQLPDELKQNSQLILAGDGEIEEGQQLAITLNVQNSITFLGWVNAETRDALLTEADVFILPSYNEGLPLALIEAMGWGLPVITTPVSGIPELVTSTENGLLVEPGDIQQLSEAMQALIKDEALRLALGSAARKTVAPLDVKNFFCRLTEIYRLVVAKRYSSSAQATL
ncbi:glycosyltransferase family 4 protein [Leptolyngbya sp. FACHB-261]|uniref:glycosyltransferase family 4 protein n=1 Tax=Leptolyngbya sp. FACHB-261 TaxID=2692806 RepID=UPI00168771BC|nr:glycosyltransferase family 4 protein [Leptolyngbya sp. FACHB-261]MBD2099689.1 glycosyltransferase family 4 protein [Leptolyngbya sp. FACHB-261]